MGIDPEDRLWTKKTCLDPKGLIMLDLISILNNDNGISDYWFKKRSWHFDSRSIQMTHNSKLEIHFRQYSKEYGRLAF